jgi:hypothetical protein
LRLELSAEVGGHGLLESIEIGIERRSWRSLVC